MISDVGSYSSGPNWMRELIGDEHVIAGVDGQLAGFAKGGAAI